MLLNVYPDILIKYIPAAISVRKINNIIYQISEFAIITITLYGKIKKRLINLLAEDFNRIRIVKREEVEDAIAFANVKNKIRYNTKYKDISLEVGDKAFLVLYRGY